MMKVLGIMSAIAAVMVQGKGSPKGEHIVHDSKDKDSVNDSDHHHKHKARHHIATHEYDELEAVAHAIATVTDKVFFDIEIN